MARRTLTDKSITALKPAAKKYCHPDPGLPSHYVRVMPSGVKSFVAVAKDPRGKQVWTTIGRTTQLGVDQAREKARAIIGAVRQGKDVAGPQTFQSVAEQWLRRHVDAKGLRSEAKIRWRLSKFLLPAWGGRDFPSIRRGEIMRLLDQVEDKSGARSADLVLSIISGMVTWYAKRNEDYTSPLVAGMRRYARKENSRDRILSDGELRQAWELEGPLGDVIKLLVLTGQRLDKVRTMRWEDLVDGTWSIPAEAREKGNAGELVLPEAALRIIQRQPRFASNPYVFAGRFHGKPRQNFHSAMEDLEVDWTLHDLRRTARSLMSRAGVRPHIAERVLGHAIGGVEGVYDRHSYTGEKAHALAALASLVGSILTPPAEKIVRLKA